MLAGWKDERFGSSRFWSWLVVSGDEYEEEGKERVMTLWLSLSLALSYGHSEQQKAKCDGDDDNATKAAGWGEMKP